MMTVKRNTVEGEEYQSLINLDTVESQHAIIIIDGVFYDTPEPWGVFFQDNATPQMEVLEELHNNIIFYLAIIMFSVSWIMLSITLNYSKSYISNKYINHGTLVELIWTITPALILIFIAFPSFKLLYLMDEVIDPSLVIYGEGHQWYWSYQYPDFTNNNEEFVECDTCCPNYEHFNLSPEIPNIAINFFDYSHYSCDSPSSYDSFPDVRNNIYEVKVKIRIINESDPLYYKHQIRLMEKSMIPEILNSKEYVIMKRIIDVGGDDYLKNNNAVDLDGISRYEDEFDISGYIEARIEYLHDCVKLRTYLLEVYKIPLPRGGVAWEIGDIPKPDVEREIWEEVWDQIKVEKSIIDRAAPETVAPWSDNSSEIFENFIEYSIQITDNNIELENTSAQTSDENEDIDYSEDFHRLFNGEQEEEDSLTSDFEDQSEGFDILFNEE